MSDNRGEKSTRRARPIARPRLPSGPLKQLKDLLYELYLDAGAPSLDQIVSWISADDSLAGAPERDTIRRCIGSADLPANQHDVAAIAEVLAQASGWDKGDAVLRARDLWVAARLIVPLGRPVVEIIDPVSLQVHPTIGVPGAPVGPPVYMKREHDENLANILKQAIDRPVMAVVVGESSTGKTRAAFEAVRENLSDWRLYHPLTPSKPRAVTDLLKNVSLAPRTVLWLDELREYLASNDGEEVAATLCELLSGPYQLAIIATIWPGDWDALTLDPIPGQPAPHPQARELLKGLACRVDIAPEFDLLQLEHAARGDLRIAQAREFTRDHGEIPQYLAAGFALRERYSTLRFSQPGAWAVLTVAMDAHRLGHPDPISEEFLEQAAPRYLSPAAWSTLSAGWFTSAIELISRPVRGAARPLAPLHPYPDEVGQPTSYQLADFLAQYARAERRFVAPPDSFWCAAVGNANNATAGNRLGDAAWSRGRLRHAAILYKSAAAQGNPDSIGSWAEVMRTFGRADQAEALLAEAVKLGNVDILTAWVARFHTADDCNRTEEFFSRAVQAGDADALRRWAEYLWRHGDRDRAERLYIRAIESGDRWARWWWANDLYESGDRSRAADLAEQDALSGTGPPSLWWVRTLWEVRRGKAEELLSREAEAGNSEAYWRWAEQIWHEDRSRAEALFAAAVNGRDEHALRRWARFAWDSQDLQGAEDLFSRAVESGDAIALWWWAGCCWGENKRARAVELYVRAANAGCWSDVQRSWADRLCADGDEETARLLARFGLTEDGRISEPWSPDEL